MIKRIFSFIAALVPAFVLAANTPQVPVYYSPTTGGLTQNGTGLTIAATSVTGLGTAATASTSAFDAAGAASAAQAAAIAASQPLSANLTTLSSLSTSGTGNLVRVGYLGTAATSNASAFQTALTFTGTGSTVNATGATITAATLAGTTSVSGTLAQSNTTSSTSTTTGAFTTAGGIGVQGTASMGLVNSTQVVALRSSKVLQVGTWAGFHNGGGSASNGTGDFLAWSTGNAPTATTVSGTAASGSTTLSLASTAGLAVYMTPGQIAGNPYTNYFPASTWISAVGTGTITLSQASTASIPSGSTFQAASNFCAYTNFQSMTDWSTTGSGPVHGINWAVPIEFTYRFQSNGNGSWSTNLVQRITISGEQWACPLSSVGIGMEIRNQELWLVAYSGSTLTQYDTGQSMNYDRQTGITLRSDGAGNLSAYWVGSTTPFATTTGAPTSIVNAQENYLVISTTNGGDTSNNFGNYVPGSVIIVGG